MKKTKKHSVILILALMMVFCLILGACSSNDIKKQTAYQLVKNAVEKTTKLDSYEIDQDVTTTTAMFDEEMKTSVQFNVKAADLTGKEPKAGGTMTMSLMGEEMKLNVYYGNDNIYISSDEADVKVKIGASEKDAQTYQFADTMNGLLKSLPEDLLKDVQVKDNENGSRTVALTIDDDRFREIYSELVSQLSNEEAYADMADDIKTTVTVKDADVSITVLPDGYIGDYNISFTMDLQMTSASMNMDYTMSMDVDSSLSFKDPGTKVTVTVPDDLDKYIDYTEI